MKVSKSAMKKSRKQSLLADLIASPACDLEAAGGLEGGAKSEDKKDKKKKEKVYPDDTTSYEGVAPLPEDVDRRRKRARRHAFRKFIADHSGEWK